jgi:hypothetical protein
MFAVDDGLINGNLNFADILFLVAAILAVLAAVLYTQGANVIRWAPVLLSLAVAGLSFGWFVL